MNIRGIDTEATSKNIKDILKARNITPKEVQTVLELESVQSVYKWLNPKSKSIPSLDNLIRLAKILNCSIEDIIIIKEANDENENMKGKGK